MAVPRHLKVVFRGKFAGTPEEWSFSTKWNRVRTGAPDLTVDNIDATKMRTAIVNFMANSRFSTGVFMDEWRAYHIGTDGKMEDNPRQHLLTASGGAVQGTGTQLYPPQIAVVITTVGLNRGRARYGRFYLPSPGFAPDTSLRLGTTVATEMLTATKTFLKAVSDSMDVPSSLESATMLNISGVGTGLSQTVDHLRIGKAFDHVERRRRQMVEDYIDGTQIDW